MKTLRPSLLFPEIPYEDIYLCEICGIEVGASEEEVSLFLKKNINGELLKLHFCSEKHVIEYLQAEQNKQRG